MSAAIQPGEAIGRPDLQESLVGIDDLDLVATVETAELLRADGMGLGAHPDATIADLRAFDIPVGWLVKGARGHGWQHRRPADGPRRGWVHPSQRADILSRGGSTGENDGESLGDETIILVPRPPEKEQEEEQAAGGRDRPDHQRVRCHAGEASAFERRRRPGSTTGAAIVRAGRDDRGRR